MRRFVRPVVRAVSPNVQILQRRHLSQHYAVADTLSQQVSGSEVLVRLGARLAGVRPQHKRVLETASITKPGNVSY